MSQLLARASLGLRRDTSRSLHCFGGSAFIGHSLGGSSTHGVVPPTLLHMSCIECDFTVTNIVARRSRKGRKGGSSGVMPDIALRRWAARFGVTFNVSTATCVLRSCNGVLWRRRVGGLSGGRSNEDGGLGCICLLRCLGQCGLGVLLRQFRRGRLSCLLLLMDGEMVMLVGEALMTHLLLGKLLLMMMLLLLLLLLLVLKMLLQEMLL